MFGFRWIQRFRLPFGIRSSLTRRGVGFSWGIPGLRFGVSPSNRKWMSFGFPGLGLYFFRYLDGNNRNKPSQFRNGGFVFDDGEVVDDEPRSRRSNNNHRPNKSRKKIKWRNIK